MKSFIKKSLSAKRESKYVDFKGSLEFSKPGAWCEIIKDIIAMANSGGGIILIGLNNTGHPTGFDVTPILELDEAVVIDKLEKYTGIQFEDINISEQTKSGQHLAAICVGEVSIPIVFIKPGTYQVNEKKQKTAFSAGTVYFRHGSKSEPGNTNDLRRVIERRLEATRKSWLKGVRKVVKAPPGSQVVTFPEDVEIRESMSAGTRAIRIVDDPDAPAYQRLDYDITHPYRQKEAIAEINRGLAGITSINSYDLLCINQIYDVCNEDNFRHCPRFGSPQYSRDYVNWVIGQFQQDKEFFNKSRKQYYEKKH